MDRHSASRRDSLGLLGAPASEGGSAEIPVLFRVADVSTPPAPTPSAAKKSAPPPQIAAPQPEKPPQATAPQVVAPPPALPAKQAIAAPPAAPPVASSETPPPLAATSEPAKPPVATPADAVSQALAAPAPAAENPATVTPADRRRAREEQASVKGDDWLATHGKLIAICFVAALLVTIVAARYRQPQVKESPDLVAGGPRIEMPAPASHPQPAVALSTDPPAVAIKPQASTADKPPDSPLFPWAEEQLRTAQRSPAPELTPAQSPVPANPAEAAPPLSAPELPSPPAAPFTQPADAPAENQPPSDGPQPNYPVTGYGDTFQLTPAPSGSQSNNSPSGIRNERTGSGLY